MTPRPRTVSDEAILRATAEVIGRLGPNRMTLADVGAAVGLSAAALVQRFGSKRNLLLALASSGPGEAIDVFAQARSAESPVDALVELMAQMGQMARTPEEMANHLAFLQIDLSDPDFYRPAKAHFDATVGGTRTVLDEAVRRGHLAETDTKQLARAVYSTASGALLNWAIHREGKAENAIREDLEVLLRPYRRGGPNTRRG